MSLGADILLKIRSTFESKPLEEAKKKTEDMGKTADKAGKDAAAGMNVMSIVAAAMSGNLTSVFSALVPLIEKLKVLNVSMRTIAIAGAFFSTLAFYFKNLKDRASEAVDALEKFRADSYERQMERIESAHARWDAANNRSLEIRKSANAFFVAEQEAYKQEALAINELAKQRELSNATSEDERRIIENKFKGRADDISGSYDAKIADKEQKRLEQEALDTEEKIKRNESLIASKQAMARKRFDDAGNYGQAASQASLGWGGVKMFGSSYDTAATKYTEKADAARSESARIFKEAEDLRNQNEQLKIAVKNSRDMAGVQGIKTRAAGVSREAASIATAREGADILSDIDKKAVDAGKAAERARLQAQIDAEEKKQKEVSERFGVSKDSLSRNASIQSREYEDSKKVVEQYRKKGDTKGLRAAEQAAMKEKAEADAATKALLDLGQQIAQSMAGYTAKIDALREQIKRVD